MARRAASASRPSSLTSYWVSLHEGVPGYLVYLIKRKKVTMTPGIREGRPVVIIKYRRSDLWNFRPTQAEYEKIYGPSKLWKTYYPFRVKS